MKRLTFQVVTATLLFLLTSICQATTFPYRDAFPEIKTIELEDLKAGIDSGEILVVDVRTPTEFNTIHVKDAINLPYSNATFSDRLLELATINFKDKIALYCNGLTCIKCYKAAEDAMNLGFFNVYAFDAGIKIWAQKFPELTVFKGKTMGSAEQIIAADSKFTEACLDFDSFIVKSTENDAVVIDARDPMQRRQPLPGVKKVLQVPLDKLVKNIISKGHYKDKKLFIFDQVGRQVNWLMFYLEENGYTNYHFLTGGATAVLKVQNYR